MTDEALFYRAFVADVRTCAGRRAQTRALEVERSIRHALVAPPSRRDRSWSNVVRAVRELLRALGEPRGDAAERLRAFVRENADLTRARDAAITDFRLARGAECVLSLADGRRFLTFTPVVHALRPPTGTLEEIVPAGARRVAEWTVYGSCIGAALAALWFAFIAPSR